MVNSLTFEGALKWLLFKLQRLLSNLDFIPTPSVASLNATCNITEKKMEKSVGARTHPCLVPLVTLKGWDLSLPSLTVTCMPSGKIYKELGATDFVQNCPETWSVDSIKCLG